jgi:sulfonate transport system permease protein
MAPTACRPRHESGFNAPASNAIGWLLPALVIAGWEIASRAGVMPANVLPAPSAVAEAFWRLTLSGELIRNIGVSTARALAGFAVGGSIGFALGLANGLSTLSRGLTDTTLQMIRNIPHLALIPLVILWFGIDEEAKLFLVALGVFFPIYVNTLLGIQSVDPQLVEMGRVYGMDRRALFFRVILPGALPAIFVGLRYALGHHVADADRRRNHLGQLRPRLHGHAGARIPADRCRRAVDPDLCAARQARRQPRPPARAAVARLASGLPERDEESTMTSRQPDRSPLLRRHASAGAPRDIGRRSASAPSPSRVRRNASATRPCSTASISTCRSGSSLPSSARAAAARARCSGCWPGSTGRHQDR